MGTREDQPAAWDFFISYTSADRAWAEWIAWVLEEDGHKVLAQTWDFVPGSNWVQGMQAGVARAARTIAVLSPDYLASEYGNAEWQAAWASDPTGGQRKLLVTRVTDCDRPGLLAGVVGVDLFRKTEAEARTQLRTMVSSAIKGRVKPDEAPVFPGRRVMVREPQFPGAPAAAELQVSEIQPFFNVTDPDRVIRLIGDALRTAHAISEENRKPFPLIMIAEALAAPGMERSAPLIPVTERIIRQIHHDGSRAQALGWLSRALSASNRARAAVLAADAERMARSFFSQIETLIPRPELKAILFTQVAEAISIADPGGAGRILADAQRSARLVDDGESSIQLLTQIATGMALIDRDRATQLARSLAPKLSRARAMAAVAKALSGSHPEEAALLALDAEWVAGDTGGPEWGWVIADVIVAMIPHDPRHATKTAALIGNGNMEVGALVEVARAMDTVDPSLAQSIAREAETVAKSIVDRDLKDRALAAVVPLIASTNIIGVESAAASISDDSLRARALAEIAVMVSMDTLRAERLIIDDIERCAAEAERTAKSVSDLPERAIALAGVAKSLAKITRPSVESGRT